MSDRTQLLEQARELDLKFAKNISNAKLQELIDEKTNEMEKEKEVTKSPQVKQSSAKEKKSKKTKEKEKVKSKKKPPKSKPKKKPPIKPDVELTKEQKVAIKEAAAILDGSNIAAVVKKTPAQLQSISRRKMLRKQRVIVTVYDPQEHKKPGCEISVCNTYSGPIKYFINYNNKPQHLTISVINVLKSREYLAMVNHTDPLSGVTVEKGVQKPSYGIQFLDPLSEEEMAQLAKDQRLVKAAQDLN